MRQFPASSLEVVVSVGGDSVLDASKAVLLKQAGRRRGAAATGTGARVQGFSSAVNVNIHLRCLMLDGVYRGSGGEMVFYATRVATGDELERLLDKIIVRLMTMLTRKGYVKEEDAMTYLTDIDADSPPLKPMQAASCIYRIAFGPRAGKQVLSLPTVASRDKTSSTAGLCAQAYGFSLHAAVRREAQTQRAIALCRSPMWKRASVNDGAGRLGRPRSASAPGRELP